MGMVDAKTVAAQKDMAEEASIQMVGSLREHYIAAAFVAVAVAFVVVALAAFVVAFAASSIAVANLGSIASVSDSYFCVHVPSSYSFPSLYRPLCH